MLVAKITELQISNKIKEFKSQNTLENGNRAPLCLLFFRIPTRENESGEDEPYIPSALLRSFITTLWADECGLIGYNFENDPKYLMMVCYLYQYCPSQELSALGKQAQYFLLHYVRGIFAKIMKMRASCTISGDATYITMDINLLVCANIWRMIHPWCFMEIEKLIMLKLGCYT